MTPWISPAARLRCAIVLLVLQWLGAFTYAHAETAVTPEPALPGLNAVLADLRRGGFVLYMRHGITDTTHGDGEGGDLAHCETQRNLSDAGRTQEAAVGRGDGRFELVAKVLPHDWADLAVAAGAKP
jgi:hypothetical protein